MSASCRYHVLRLGAAALVAGGLLAGCAAKKEEYKEQTISVLYNRAMNALEDGDYKTASSNFDEVDRQHPSSPWATKAQLMAGYSLYKANKMDDAVSALDRFIQLHPGHRDVAYAYYLKALCYYEQIADVARDQGITEQAQKALQELMRRFPNSKYARDAKFKLDLVRDHLAGREMNVGRFYQRQKEYLAAIMRYRVVVEKFQTTTQVPEALERMVECYQALGLTGEAHRIAAVLGYNYPGSDWYQDAYDLVGGEKAAKGPAGTSQTGPAKKDSGWFGWIGDLF